MMKKIIAFSIILNLALGAGFIFLAKAHIDLLKERKEMRDATEEAGVPVVYVAEGGFSEEEKMLLEERVIRLYVDYETCLGKELPLVMRVEKSEVAGVLYHIEALRVDGYDGFFAGVPGRELEYYEPVSPVEDCLHVLTAAKGE